jgi:hypothetical protein
MTRPRIAQLSRRHFLVGLGSAVAAFQAATARAAGVQVPLDLQAKLTAKVAMYDRNLASRAGAEVITLIVATRGVAESERAATHLQSVFQSIDKLAGKPHKVSAYWYQGAAKLAADCQSRHAAIVYITPGFDQELGAIRKHLTGVSILSIGVDPASVANGVVLGFKLVDAKPKVIVNLGQAKRQNVAFSAALLQLAEVIQ